jgi:quinolinate synthase
LENINLQEKILSLKEKKKALILAHNYQTCEIQEIADFVGDSLELCRKAQKAEESDLIIFCGVDFMAETASILNPSKKVILPNLRATCPMAAMLPKETLIKAKEKHQDAPIVLYINTSAQAKTQADVICTSANAVKVINSLKAETVLFGPDRNLAWYVSQKIKDKTIIPVPEDGYCHVHRFFGDGSEALEIKKRFPEAEILVHPECEPKFQMKADYVLSTGGIYRRCKRSSSKTFIIGTEINMVERLRREIPGKMFAPAKINALCTGMKKINLRNTYEALLTEEPVVKLSKEVSRKAYTPIKHMMQL